MKPGVFSICARISARIFFQLQKIIRFLQKLNRRVVLGADISGQQFLFGVEALASDAIKSFIFAEVNIAALITAREHLAHELLMHRIGGAHEVVVADVKAGVRGAKQRTDLVGERLWVKVYLRRGVAIFLAVLVGAGDEGYVCASEFAPHVARKGVGGQVFVGVANVRRSVAIGDRRSDMDSLSHGTTENNRRQIATRLGEPRGGRSD